MYPLLVALLVGGDPQAQVVAPPTQLKAPIVAGTGNGCRGGVMLQYPVTGYTIQAPTSVYAAPRAGGCNGRSAGSYAAPQATGCSGATAGSYAARGPLFHRAHRVAARRDVRHSAGVGSYAVESAPVAAAIPVQCTFAVVAAPAAPPQTTFVRQRTVVAAAPVRTFFSSSCPNGNCPNSRGAFRW